MRGTSLGNEYQHIMATLSEAQAVVPPIQHERHAGSHAVRPNGRHRHRQPMMSGGARTGVWLCTARREADMGVLRLMLRRSSVLSALGRLPYMVGDMKLAAMLGRPSCSQRSRSSCAHAWTPVLQRRSHHIKAVPCGYCAISCCPSRAFRPCDLKDCSVLQMAS